MVLTAVLISAVRDGAVRVAVMQANVRMVNIVEICLVWCNKLAF